MTRRVIGITFILALLFPGATISPHVSAGSDCVASAYIGGIQAANEDVAASPPRVSAARAQLITLQQRDAPYPPILTPVLDDLTAAPPNLGDARLRLQQLASGLAVPAGSTCRIDSSAAHDALRDVYADRVFAGLDATAQPSLLSVILGFIARLVRGAVGTLGLLGSVLVAVLVLGLALGYAAWRARNSRASRQARIAGDEPAAPGSDPAMEWAAAERAAAQGQYREAVRRGFRSALLEVALSGGRHIDSAWTTRELLGSLTADTGLLAALAPAAAAFDYAWYSGDPVGADLWELARSRCAAARSLARGRMREPVR